MTQFLRWSLLPIAALAAGAVAWPSSALAQKEVPPPCPAIKGRVVAVEPSGTSVTVDRQGGRRETHPVAPVAAERVRALAPGSQITLKLNCLEKPQLVVDVLQVVPPPKPTPIPGRDPDGKGRELTTVLISSPEACTLELDFKPWGALKADGRSELKLSPGEHQLEATTPDGRSWKEKIKVSSDQIIVEVKFGKPVATVAEYDAQAGKVCGALGALKTAGQGLDAILRDKKYKFHNADSSAVSGASASWVRELTILKELVAPAERVQATTDLASIDASVKEYGDLLVKGLETAQEKNTVMGEATTLRGKAQALAPLLSVPPATAKLLPFCAAASR